MCRVVAGLMNQIGKTLPSTVQSHGIGVGSAIQGLGRLGRRQPVPSGKRQDFLVCIRELAQQFQEGPPRMGGRDVVRDGSDALVRSAP